MLTVCCVLVPLGWGRAASSTPHIAVIPVLSETLPYTMHSSGSLVSLSFPPSKGVGKRAQAPTRDRSQACFFRVIMRAFISLQENAWRRAHVVAAEPLAQVAAQAQPPQVCRDP